MNVFVPFAFADDFRFLHGPIRSDAAVPDTQRIDVFQDEWTYVWRRMNFSAATVIFIINRYFVIPIIALEQSLMWSSSVELSNAVSLNSFDVPKSKNNLKISVILFPEEVRLERPAKYLVG